MKFIYEICHKYGKFYSISKHYCSLWGKSCLTVDSNLKRIEKKFAIRYYSTIFNDNLTEKSVKNFLDHATKVYEGKEEDKSEIGEILEIHEVKKLVQDRINIIENIQSLDELMKDDKEMKQLANEELTIYKNSLKTIDENLIEKLSICLGRDLCENIILEITAGVGGQESMLFAYNLLEMYCHHLNYLDYNYEFIDRDMTAIGGIRHASITINGQFSYEKFRHEAGIHRVQRIPITETSGRIHTSVVSVVIYPQPNEIEVKINDKDLRIDTFRSTGAGGQNVNKTDSAVRIVHIPTNTVVECQAERSQIRNKKIAMIKLRTKIYETRLNEQVTKNRDIRRKQMGFKNRNERIRTYNYMQDRITDHRLVNGTYFGMDCFMKGGVKLNELQDKLQRNYERKLLIDIINENEKKTR
ncbi:peptide chain release factor 1-like, mitochondrial [Leptopilina boulardi]|uniref:peptide chain release factor 1-like, mitochondrial n=1 Tax=Leptopilina boulardi TaxID=63433 RepID=UPI0021F5FE17|nr:peptide chain release factor 1-like, mitochondrial [Leptopilina boulardi]